ncbi:ABC transporter substrate-binding protein [Arcobacter sp. s6]|uniref:ABC transporter substrate-binding protein n=1 Tax=Arcobacter sp. s6 TaxID=3230363 RepID=UPI0034A037CF
MFIKKLLLTCLLLAASLNAKERITLYLDWINQFQFAGYYMAKEKGYYDKLGIDLEIVEYSNNHNVVNKVIENSSNYGIGKSSLIIDKFEGKNVILLSSFFQSSPLVLITLKSSNIKTPKDLVNKKVMITQDAKDAIAIKAMIVSQGMKMDELNIQDHSFDINDLINGKTDAMACYLSNEPLKLKEKNIKYNIINPYDFGFDFYEGILFTSQKELNENPIRVQNFNQASIQGWEYAFNNIEESAKVIYEKYNSQNKTLKELIYEGNSLKKLSKIDENLLGNIDYQIIEEIKRFYTLLGLNSNNKLFDTKDVIFNKNDVLINEEEKKYLEDNSFALLVQNNKIPFSFKTTNELVGAELDFWDLISKKLSKSFNIEEIIQTEFINIFSDSIKGKFIYSFEESPSDKHVYSDPIIKIPVSIATKNNVNFINDLSSLKNIKIGILKDLKLIDLLKNDYPNIEFEEINSIKQGINKLKADEIFGLIDNFYTLSHSITSELKINNSLKYEIGMRLEVEKKNEKFIHLINKIANTLTQKEKNDILNSYQLISYQQNFDISYLIQYIIPLIILLIILIFLNFKLKKEVKVRKETEIKLSKFANKDSLTNIYNRRKIEELCENEIKRSERYNYNLSLIFFDLNDFKLINDLTGHHKGDDVLIKIADTVSQNIRSSDYFGRWGGDEFLIVLPHTDLVQAEKIIKVLESKINQIDFDLKKDLILTCSFGLCQYEVNDTLDSLLKKADASMYAVKNEYKRKKNIIA